MTSDLQRLYDTELQHDSDDGLFCMIDGGMLAGKSLQAEILLERWVSIIGSKRRSRNKGMMFTPAVDDRGSLGVVTIHSTIEGQPYKEVPAELVRSVEDIVKYVKEHDNIGAVVIDEGHMYLGEHREAISELKKMGIQVFGTYLDFDFRREDFPMPNGVETTRIIREDVADRHIPLFAYCEEPRNGDVCGAFAIYSQRFLQDGRIAPLDDSTIAIGGKKGVDSEHAVSYRPVCENCYVQPLATMADLNALASA